MAISPFPKQGQGFRAEVKISENMDLILNGLVWTRICVGNLRCKGESGCGTDTPVAKSRFPN